MLVNGVIYALSPQKQQPAARPQKVVKYKSSEQQFSESLHKAIKEKVDEEKGYDPYTAGRSNNFSSHNYNSPYSSDNMSALDDPYGIRKK